MLLISRRLATGLLLVPIGGIRFAGAAPDATAHITFILVNDIYLMADELMPDGHRRGGFARLAAVVKAERAKASATSGHTIFAHGGDTLSPSLMSGIDHGKHIMTLTNLIPPDIFVPGNHEFDFGKATFLQRMAEAKFPLYAANLRGPEGQPLPNFKDRSIVTVDGVRIGLTGAPYDDSVRASDPGDLRFLPTVATLNEQAAALRREGSDLVVAVAHVANGGGVRGDKIYPPGTTITRREVLAELPFGNRLVTIDVRGSALKAAIENGLSLLPTPSGRFPQVAGLKIEADFSRPAGNRVLSIMVGDTPLDANKTYSVATSDFMARGGDDYVAFRDAKPVLPPADSPTVAYEVIDYIKSIGTIRTGVDGRIVLK